jgi:Tfp pilus assembly protein FimT
MGPRHLFREGFTIIEILLVVIILLAVVGLTVPSFGPAYARLQLKKTAEDLVFVMRYAQSRCVMSNRRIRLELDAQGSGYQLMQASPSDGRQAPDRDEEGEAFEPVGGRWGRAFKIPPEIVVQSDGPFVYFFPDGSIEKREISVCRRALPTGPQERCLTVSTQGYRGRVRILAL